MHILYVCFFPVNLWHSPRLGVLIGSTSSVNVCLKHWQKIAVTETSPAVGGSNPEFNFSHFALLHLWLEWIMIISWLWFGPCLWAWGHSLSELNRWWQWGACATHWVCSVRCLLSHPRNTSCTLCRPLFVSGEDRYIELLICGLTSDLLKTPP